MHSVYFKEYEGIVQNPVGHLSAASAPWWSGLGTQLPYGESVGELKSLSVEHHSNGDQFTATKIAEHATEQGLGKGITSQFTIFPGNFLSCACFVHFAEMSDSLFYSIEPLMGIIISVHLRKLSFCFYFPIVEIFRCAFPESNC